MTSISGIRGILLDIEGTTTPIAFVHDVLFPYARSHVKTYLTTQWDAPETLADVAGLRREHAVDVQHNLKPPPLVNGPHDAELDSVVDYVHWLIDRDRKSTSMKSLQGEIWRQGYLDGSLQAPLFPDILPAFESWRRAGLKIAIFSSGSTVAQKLLFAHTEAGDVSQNIDEYFDTTTGPKTATESYRRIAADLGFSPEEVMFISDVTAELNAAVAAGMHVLLCVRPGNQEQMAEGHQTVRSFGDVLLSA